MTPERTTAPKLTKAQKRHLGELLDVALGSDGRIATWGPANSGEWACAHALTRLGFLSFNPSRGVVPFKLTATGYAAALRLGENPDD